MKLLCALGVSLIFVFVPASYGDIILDQQYSFSSSVASSTNGDVSQMGQTFTVGIGGTLDHIDVLMFRLGGIFETTGDPVLSVYNVSGGLPFGSPLATVSIPEINVPYNNAAMVSFDLSAAAISLNVGDILAFSVTASSGVGPYFLLTDQGQPIEYGGGNAIAKFGANPWQTIAPNQDHGFQTFVNAIPEPATGTLLLLSSLLIGAVWRNRKR